MHQSLVGLLNSVNQHTMKSLAQHTTLWPMKTPASCTLWAVALVIVDYTWLMSMILLIQSLPAVLDTFVRMNTYMIPSALSTMARMDTRAEDTKYMHTT